MKTFNLNMLLLLALLITLGCSDDEAPPRIDADPFPEGILNYLEGAGLQRDTDYGFDENGAAYKFELIIKYPDTATEADKQAVRDAAGQPLSDVKRCDCTAFEQGEVWTNIPPGQIETRRQSAANTGGTEGTEYNYIIYDDRFDVFPVGNPNFNPDLYDRLQTTPAPTDAIRVAILDTGLEVDHPGLFDAMNNLAPNLSFYSDDCGVGEVGYNFVDNGQATVDDLHGHGSHVAGIVVQLLSQSTLGTAYPYELMILSTHDENGLSDVFSQICAYDYAFERDVQLINNSSGWYSVPSDILRDLMANEGANTLIVASAGNSSNNNDTRLHYPSDYLLNNVLSIGAYDDNLGQYAPFSNFGTSNVDIAAPGVVINSFVPSGGFEDKSGTSMAAPYVTASLIYAYHCYKAQNSGTAPTMNQWVSEILSNGKPLPSGSPSISTGQWFDLGDYRTTTCN